MKTLTIDTHKVVELLQQKGFSKDQAEGLIDAAREVDTSELATMRALSDVESTVTNAIEKLRTELYRMVAIQTFVIIGALIALAFV